jgi:hypothetical protein
MRISVKYAKVLDTALQSFSYKPIDSELLYAKKSIF